MTDTRKQVEAAIAIVLGADAAMTAAEAVVGSRRFNPEDDWADIAFAAARAWRLKHGSVPADARAFELAVADIAAGVDPLAVPAVAEFAVGPLAYYRNADKASVDWALSRLQRYFLDMAANKAATRLASGEDADKTLDAAVSEVAALRTAVAPAFTPMFAPGWDLVPARVASPTGVVFLDKHMDGGLAAGEICAITGPRGSCKTTVACMLMAETAARYAAIRKGGGKKKLAVLFSYESTGAEMQSRVLGYAGRIARATLKEAAERTLALPDAPFDVRFENLSASGKLKEYERAMFSAADAPGEKERLHTAVDVLREHWFGFDFTGFDPKFRGMGQSGTKELALRLRQLSEQFDAEIGFVVFDYAGLAVKKWLETAGVPSHKIDSGLLSREIGGLAMAFKGEIAVPFRCPVVILYQASSEANSKAPGSVLRTEDGAGSKYAAENVAFSFALGVPTKEGLLTCNCDKQRDAARRPVSVLRFHPHIAAVMDADDEYMVDTVTNQLIERDALGASKTPKTRPGVVAM